LKIEERAKVFIGSDVVICSIVGITDVRKMRIITIIWEDCEIKISGINFCHVSKIAPKGGYLFFIISTNHR
jgi:hypothetical protein